MKRIAALLVASLLALLVISLGVTQEVPLGSVKGRVTLGDSKMPLPKGLVTISPARADENKEDFRPLYAETDENGNFRIPKVPAGTYEVEVSARYHTLKTTLVFVDEGKESQLDLAMARGDDSLSVYNSQRVITPDEVPELEVHGFFKTDTLKATVRRLNLEELAKAGGIGTVAYPLSTDEGGKMPLLKASPVELQFDQTVANKDPEGAFINRLKVPKLPEGLYWLTVRAGKLQKAAFINVSKLALVTKTYGSELLCYTTNLKTGEPVAGVQILAPGPQRLQTLGKTDAKGLLKVRVPAGQGGNQRAHLARLGASVAMVGYWGYDSANSKVRLVGYTERPVYRPGDTVKFKGIARQVESTDLSLPPAGSPIDVELRSPDGTILQTERLTLSEHGSFHGEFTTSREGAPGYYSLSVRGLGSTASIGVELVAYRKPQYKVTIRPNGGPFVLGQDASVTVDCEYYFGGPVAGAKITAGVYRSRVYGDIESEYRDYDGSGAGEYSQDLTATTDEAGHAVLTFPTKVEGDPAEMDADYEYEVYASVADADGKFFDGQGSIRVYRGLFDVDLETDRYFVEPGQTVNATVKLTGVLDDKAPVAGQPVELEVGQWRWTENTSVLIPRQTLRGTSNGDGTASFALPFPESGDFQLRARAKDREGRTVTATDWLYVSGGASGRPQPSLKVQLDRKEYQPTDTAKAMIETDQPGGSALLTIQADGILNQQVLPLKDRTTVVSLPLELRYAPNVFVSVAYVRNKEFAEDTTQLNVANASRDLTVQVRSLRETYQPGETAEVEVVTTDSDGRPAAAEVSLAVVDESIYTIRADNTDIRAMLNPRRYDQVQTNYSFPEVYLDGGDKGGGDIPLRKRFEDTAEWLPTLWTGTTGKVTTKIRLPDNLTQWRMTAIAVNDRGAAGQSTGAFRARKPLMVRVSPPVFLVKGDQTEVSITVTNDTGADRDVRLQIDAEGVSLTGDKSPLLKVAQGKSETIRLPMSAPATGDAVIRARAWADSQLTDGVEVRFPVIPHGRREVSASSGIAAPANEFTFEKSADADSAKGQLTVYLAPSLAGGTVQALDELVDFPYGCVEQTMSRFMPAVVVADSLQRLNLKRPALSERIPRVAADSMARLGKMQHGDGGWGWWEYDSSDSGMTALVLDGLDRAQRAGYPAKGVQLNSALDWAEARWKQPAKEDPLRSRLYLAYALLRHGRKVPDLAKINLAKASSADLATAALAFHEAGLTTLAESALNRLVELAEVGPIQARWVPGPSSWGEESTALGLVALTTVAPNHPLIPKIVRGLMDRRTGDGWQSTRDTSYAIIGLVSVLNQDGQGETAKSVTVNVGNQTKVVAIDASDPDGARVTIPIADLPSGPFSVKVTTDGGRVYASAELTQYVDSDPLGEVSQDLNIRVTRTYRKMEPRRIEDGTTRLLPSERPVSEVKAGDLIQVEVKVEAKRDAEFVMVEDPIPSNCRLAERAEIDSGESWGWWWSRTEVRDDRIVFFARTLPKGSQSFTYMMRAEMPGETRGMPTHLERMYEPALWSSSAENRLVVRP